MPRRLFQVLLLNAALACAPHAAHAAAPAAAESVSAPVPAAAVAAAPAPPARDYLAEARASFTPANRAYSSARVVVLLAGPLYGVLCGLLLLFSGLSARFRDIAHGLGHRRYVRVLVYFTLYATAMFVLGLPLAWYQEYALEHRFGLSTQGLGGWLLDAVKGLVTLVVGLGVLPLLALAWRSVELSPRRWWLWLAAGCAPVLVAAMLLEPLVLDPLYNRFTPLHDPGLRTEILALAGRAGVPAQNVYQVDMGTRTRKLNAYVNGFGSSLRVVLWDTTLREMKRDEILFVTAHELGHYALGHPWWGLVFMVLAAFPGLWLAARGARFLVDRFGEAWGTRGVGDLAAFPAIALSLTLVSLAATPAVNALSRSVEHAADVFALDMTHDGDAAQRAFLALAQGNRSNPEPSALVRFLLYDHPALAERIRFARDYHPWSEGRPGRYDARIRR